MHYYLHRTAVAQFVKEKLPRSRSVSPWTMTIEQDTSEGYFAVTVTEVSPPTTTKRRTSKLPHTTSGSRLITKSRQTGPEGEDAVDGGKGSGMYGIGSIK